MRKIFLSNGDFTWVSDADYILLYPYNWSVNNRDHVVSMVAGKYRLMSRIIAERIGLDLSKQIDHIDRNPLNNQRENLRSATHSQNMANSKTRNSKSGLKGAYKQGNRWLAKIQVNRQVIHLGTFDSPEEAHQAYVEAAEYYFGEFANY